MGARNMNPPATIVSSRLRLKCPASPPDIFPIIKTSTVVVKRSPNVQGKDWPIICITGVGKDTSEGPKSNEASLRQKVKYWVNKGSSRPYISFSALTVASAAFGSV